MSTYGPQYLQFDLTRIQAEVISDEDGWPALVIRSGDETQHAVELSGGAHMRDAVAGARRITEAIWTYIMAIEAKRHNGAVEPPTAWPNAVRNDNPAGNADAP